MTKQEIFNNSIVIVGAIGSGKSLFSEELARKTGLPIITADLLRHCPKNPNELVDRISKLKNDYDKLSQTIQVTTNKEELENLSKFASKLSNDIWSNERQLKMRKLLPNVANYKEMGFDGRASDFLRENFGITAWHFYQKQFENELLRQVVINLPCPAIIDLGGGMAISLEKDYSFLTSKFKSLNEDLFNKHINIEKTGFNHIEKALKPFKNVLYLRLPINYQKMKKARNNHDLNDLFINTKQYEKLSTLTIDTETIIEEEKINETMLSSVVNDIITKTKITTKVENQQL